MTNKYLTAEETAAELRLHLRTVQKLCGTGQLPASKVGGEWRIDRQALQAHLRHPNWRPMSTSPKSGELFRRWNMKIGGLRGHGRATVDTGADRYLVLINDGGTAGNDDLHVVSRSGSLASPEDIVPRHGSLTVDGGRVLWSPGKCRVRVEEYWR